MSDDTTIAQARDLFVQLGGRSRNYGKLYLLPQATKDGRVRFVVRLSEGAVIETLITEWEGREVLYIGPGENVPEFT